MLAEKLNVIEILHPAIDHTLTTDWWEGHVEKEVGPNYGKPLQHCGVHKTIREARKKGYTISCKTVAHDGSIKLTLGGVQ